jgi:immunoglobulin-binding protein 1
MNHQSDDARNGVGGGGDGGEASNTTTIGEAYQKAIALLSSDPGQALCALQVLQERVASLSLFSRNEALEDISTGSLPLVALEHYLALAYTQQPMNLTTTAISRVPTMQQRQGQLHLACDLWMNFLQRLQQLELFANNSNLQEEKEYERLQELVEAALHVTSSSSSSNERAPAAALLASQPCSRDVKIARFQAKKEAQEQRNQYLALQERRQRLNVCSTDEMDGHDEESLSRIVALQSLEIAKHEALEELYNVLRELPMIAHMIQQEQEANNRHQSMHSNISNNANSTSGGGRPAAPPSQQNGPLKLTHITKNDITGQLQVRRQEIQNQVVFRHGWNQPTMSLQELAEKEVAQAMERDERQKVSEAANKLAPRRYEQLEKDGLEDDVDLVDASAELDRKWDDWKDENPRGSGNKRGNVGDKNF